MKKLLATLLASTMALSAIAGLVACGGGNDDEGEVKPVSHELAENLPDVANSETPITDTTAVPATELKVWCPDGAIATYTKLANEFKSADYMGGKYANVTVTFEAKPEGEVETGLGTDASTGPDLFFFEAGQIQNMVDKNFLAPLSSTDEGAYYTKAISMRDSKTTYEPVVYNGYCYAFPATDDNGWFMWYNSDLLGENDIKTLDGIVAKAKELNKGIMFDYGNGWYISSFWQGAGCTMDYAGKKYVTDVDGAVGKKVGEAVWNYLTPANNKTADGETDVFIKPAKDGNSETANGLNDETLIAGFQGSWIWNDIARKDNIKPSKCPTYTLDGEQVKMGSFKGSKYCGVNAKRDNKSVAMALANYFTSQHGQELRFANTSAVPTNKVVAASDAVKENDVAMALSTQNAENGYAQLKQSSGFWDAMAAFGNGCADGSTSKKDASGKALKNLAKAMRK